MMRSGRCAAVTGGVLLGLALSMTAPGGAGAAEPAFPYVDVNNDGVYQAGTDSGDVGAALTSGFFHSDMGGWPGTPGLVVPRGVNLSGDGMDIQVPGDIRIRGNVISSAGLVLTSTSGSVLIDARADVRADGMLNILAFEDVVIGTRAAVVADGGLNLGDIDITSTGGAVSIGLGATISAVDRLFVRAPLAIEVSRNARLTGEFVQLLANEVSVRSATITLDRLVAVSRTGDLDMRDTTLRTDASGLVSLSARAHTVDLRGMRCVGMNENRMSVAGARVVR